MSTLFGRPVVLSDAVPAGPAIEFGVYCDGNTFDIVVPHEDSEAARTGVVGLKCRSCGWMRTATIELLEVGVPPLALLHAKEKA